jgi:formylglycine-generating enzyme required for sulfatase activity
VTWTQCRDLLLWLGLELPSEAQWEYGARGGTDMPWWTGFERESLRGKVNLADQSAKRGGAPWDSIEDWPDLDDGFPCHAPVGSLPANPYGLHEVVGNVYEWCADGHGPYPAQKQRDPFVSWKGARKRVNHGGSFAGTAWRARSANREDHGPDAPYWDVGLRPARRLEP